MAMLAEKKRRQKWCLNPRGNYWSDDNTKFGQRLLEKMGWRAGEGLGVNKQGLKQVIHVKVKDDNKGLGFKEKGEEWIKTTSDFNQLLDQLASTENSEKDQINMTSLEDRSKKSKARVHYHKFTRGKDISRYSEKDLASIIGPDAVKSKTDSSLDEYYKPNQINKGCSTDYFSSKKKDPLPELTVHETPNQEDIEEEAINLPIKKHKKSKKSKETQMQNSLELNSGIELISEKSKNLEQIDEVLEIDFQSVSDPNMKKQTKKKSKKLNSEVERECEVDVEPVNQFEETSTILNNCSKNSNIIKKKRKVKCLENANSIETIIDKSIDVSDAQPQEHIENKKKRKNFNYELISTANKSEFRIELETPDKINNTPFEESSGKECLKVDRKSKRKTTESTSNEAANDIENVEVKCEEEDSTFKLSKSKKKTVKDDCKSFISCDNTTNKNQSTSTENNDVVLKKKKRKEMQYDDQGLQLVKQVEVVENELNTIKKGKKVKTENSNEIIEGTEDHGYKRIKSKIKNNKEELIANNNIYEFALNYELNEPPPNEENLTKHSKSKKKSKTKNSEGTVDTKEPAEVSNNVAGGLKKEKLDIKKNKCNLENERTSINDNKDKSSTNCKELLTVFGRQTRLKQLNKPLNPRNDDIFVTEEYIPFNKKENVSLEKATENKQSNKPITKLLQTGKTQTIFVTPDNVDSNISMYAAIHEHKLLKNKIKEWNIPTQKVRIVLKDGGMHISEKLRSKLDIIYRSKYLKTLLPEETVLDIGGSVVKFDDQVQPKIDQINKLKKFENQLEKFASESQETFDILADSSNQGKGTPPIISSPMEKKTFKAAKKQLKLLLNHGLETECTVFESGQDIANETNVRTDNVVSKKRKQTRKNLEEDYIGKLFILQTKINEKIKTLNDQVKLAAEGKEILTKKTDTENNEVLLKEHEMQHKTPSSKRGHKGTVCEDYSSEKNVDTNQYVDFESNNFSAHMETSDAKFGSNSFRGKGSQVSWGKGYGLGQGAFTSQVERYSFRQGEFRGQMRGGSFGQRTFRGQMRGGGYGRGAFRGQTGGYNYGPSASRGQMRGRGFGQGAFRGQMRGYNSGPSAFRGQMRGVGFGQGTFRGQMRRGNFGLGNFRGQIRGRGRGPVRRGRISKNNFDAKQYAEKCKTMNIVPAIAFKGVDLQNISGYAADKKESPTT